jgi:hypothetical protein
MLDLLGTVLTGGATGIIGSIIGKAFSFLDFWVEEKKADGDHARTVALLELQNRLGAEESERELEIAKTTAAGNARTASYQHDIALSGGSMWVVDILRLIRPILTFTLIILVGILYFKAAPGGRDTIEISVIYMCSSAVLWWFGDRAMRKK